MQVQYIAMIHKEESSDYGVSFPDVPGVIPVANALDEALHEAASVLAFAFEDWQGDLPAPRSLDDLRKEADFRKWSTDAVVAAVAPAPDLANAA